ncbi:type I inositol polyphosphate 5-phosphatase 1-like isoform X2 [Tasmannia lanceolata]|uniref:type I inositol polyphosphate 5-phosphatase 1-like isoform X2 n=1 Tax=Tasmannia lanceolata TaxID=3420 RepID=UPI004064AA7C
MKQHRRNQREWNWAEILCFGCTCLLQHYWSRTVLKKWLNRENRESDFSADERDSESEFEDEETDCWERELCNEDKKTNELLFGPNEDFPFKSRRRNSETLRAQYIDSKEIRIRVGTWNVGGRLPPDDLDINDWLDIEEPADIYVLGLQEVVPLNAGNIFGAEDNRPVPKWEYLIREALNRIQPIKAKFKCYSDPPSPSRFKPSDDVPDIGDEILHETDSESDEEVYAPDEESLSINTNNYGCTTSRKESRFYEEVHCSENANLGLSKIGFERQYSPKRLDRLNCLKLEDDNTSSETSVSLPKAKLTKMLSVSERVGLSWPEQPLDLLPRRVLSRPNSFRASSSFKLSLHRDYKGLSGETFIPELNLESVLNRKRRSAFVRIVSKQMVGIFLTIWVRRTLRKHIQNLKVSTVGVGVMGFIGNKGSISVSMSIYQTHFCFVCTHLTSGEKDADGLKRNADVQEIHRRTHFNAKNIHDHERIIWFGDLNYRINLSYEKTREFISNKEWSKLAERDQLIRELKKGHVFDGWSEGTLNFSPTYKYEFNSKKYFGEDPKAGRRTPAWCDRILSFGKGMRLLKYKRIEQSLSDHRPVIATFMAEVEVFSHRKLQRALTFTDAELENDEIISEMNIDVGRTRLRVEEDLGDWER